MCIPRYFAVLTIPSAWLCRVQVVLTGFLDLVIWIIWHLVQQKSICQSRLHFSKVLRSFCGAPLSAWDFIGYWIICKETTLGFCITWNTIYVYKQWGTQGWSLGTSGVAGTSPENCQGQPAISSKQEVFEQTSCWSPWLQHWLVCHWRYLCVAPV